MRNLTHSLLTLALAATAGCATPPDDGRDGGSDAGTFDGGDVIVLADSDVEPEALRVLFIGNSYTFVNDLPGMLARMAATAGAPPIIEVEELTAPGATLAQHWTDPEVRGRIAAGGWTHVVLQGQSGEAVGPYVSFTDFSDLLGDMVLNVGAQPVWFVTPAWAAASFSQPYEALLTQDRITQEYGAAAQRTPGSLLACVGEAYRASLNENPSIVLHQEDHSHATVAGTYLGAATFYVALTGRPVSEQAEVPDALSDVDAASLREVAARVGSHCADVRVKGNIRVRREIDWGSSAIPITSILIVENDGEAPVQIRDGMTLAPPFRWAGDGVYPGGEGSAGSFYAWDESLEFCGATLTPEEVRCALGITFDGESTGDAVLTLLLDGAYVPVVEANLHATAAPADRALLIAGMWPDVSGYAPPSGDTVARTWPGEMGGDLQMLITNVGGVAATSLGGSPLAFPFSWGPYPTTGEAFPGGMGVGSFDPYVGQLLRPLSYPYCAERLEPGQRCMATFSYAPGAEPAPHRATIEVIYEDAMGSGATPAIVPMQVAWTPSTDLTLSHEPGRDGCVMWACEHYPQLAPVAAGATSTLDVVVSNHSAAPFDFDTATFVLSPVAEPFHFGTDRATPFPGGSGVGTVRDVPYPYCPQTGTLGPDEQCMVTIGFSPSEANRGFFGSFVIHSAEGFAASVSLVAWSL